MLATVDIRLAFAFDCANCGRENFVRSVIHEFTPDEQADAIEQIGERPETGSWITHPEMVHCQHCGSEFKAVNPGELVDQNG